MTHQQPTPHADDRRLADVVPIGLGYRPAATPGAPETTVTQVRHDQLVPTAPDRDDDQVVADPVPVDQPDVAADTDRDKPGSGVIVPRRAAHPGVDLAAAARAIYGRTATIARHPAHLAWAMVRHEIYFGGLGTARGIAALWAWASARELDQHLATNPKLVLDTRQRRQRVALAGAGVTTAAGIATWLTIGPAAIIAAVALILAVAGAVERTRRTDTPTDGAHAALGTHPGSKAVRHALAAARLGKADQIRVIGPVTRTNGAWEATIELPPGTTYKAAARRRGEVAGAIGVDEVQVALDPVRGHAGRVRLWVADEDPMQGERVVNPLTLVRDGRVNFWRDKLFAGRDVRGREVAFRMVERSYLIGGEPGGGKSVASNNVLAFFFLDPRVRVYLADGKFGFDLMVWEPMAAGVQTDRDPEAMLPFLEEIQAEMDRRYDLLRKLGTPKITEEIAKRHDLHPIVLHIDEVQYWTAGPDKRLNDRIMVLLADLVGRGRAAGIITGVITQRPAAEVVPTRLRDILSIRWALRCTSPAASDTILGSGWSGRGYSASLFEPDQRGAGYILAEGSTPVQTRAAFIDPDRGELQAIADRAYDLRREAGTLPATTDRPEIRLLTTILSVMDHPKGAHTADLLERLARASDEYTGWDAARLAAALRPLGVTSRQLDIDGRNRNGYRRDVIQDALDRA